MIIIWNRDGSLKTFINNEAINQHSHRVNFIQFAVDGMPSSEHTGDVVFTLPNQDTITKVANPKEIKHKGIFYQGFEVALTDDVTLLDGILHIVCRVLGNQRTLYTYQFDVNINKTISQNVRINQVDQNQYEQILSLLTDYAERYDVSFVRKYDTLQLATQDTNLQQGAVILVLVNGEYQYYRKQGNTLTPYNYKGYEELVREIATEIKSNVGLGNISSVGLAHDGQFLQPQEFVSFKSINGQSILGSEDLKTFKEVIIIGHNGTFTTEEINALNGDYAYIKDIDDGIRLNKVRDNLYCAMTFDINDVIRLWMVKIANGNQWTLDSKTLALRGEVHEPIAVKLANAKETATNGILTESEFLTLTTDQNSFIYFNKEKYNLADNMHNIGSMTYTHLGYENNVFVLKAITITLANKTWVLNEKELI